MRQYIVRRLAQSVVTLFILALTIFVLVRLTGDPAVMMAGDGASTEDIDQIRSELGTDQPIPTQFVQFLGDVVTLDFGTSFNLRQGVTDVYFDRLPNSMLLVTSALLFALAVGIPAGIISAVYPGGWRDKTSTALALGGMSIPSFVVALTLMYVISLRLGWLPTSGIGTWQQLIMPTVALGWYFAASTLRIVRSAMLDVLGSEYVKLARLKGMSERIVIARHAFKNALIPLITLTAVNFVVMINAAVVVEVIFVWPGIGSLLFEAVQQRDFPVVQGVVIMAGIIIIAANTLVDFMYAWIDPRIRLTR